MPDAVWLTNSNKCGTCGATVGNRERPQHENFHKTFSNIRGDDMSNVAWCDYGDHAFKRGTPGSASFQGTEIDQHGQSVATQMDACPDHNPLTTAREAQRLGITTEAYQAVTTETSGGNSDRDAWSHP